MPPKAYRASTLAICFILQAGLYQSDMVLMEKDHKVVKAAVLEVSAVGCQRSKVLYNAAVDDANTEIGVNQTES